MHPDNIEIQNAILVELLSELHELLNEKQYRELQQVTFPVLTMIENFHHDSYESHKLIKDEEH